MKTTLKTVVLFFVLFAFSASSFAMSDTGYYLQLGVSSAHKEMRKDGRPWNQNNTGIGIQYYYPGTFFSGAVEYYRGISTIKNSEFGDTVHIGGGFRKKLFDGLLGNISIGVIAGIMNYPSEYNEEKSAAAFFPVALPTLSICNKKRVCMDGMYIPKVQKNKGSAALLFTIRFMFEPKFP